MALKGRYKDTDLFKSLPKAVPKARLGEARKFAAGFGVKKHTTQAMGQHDTLQFVGKLEKKHLLKSHIKDLPTYSSTKKEILEAMIGALDAQRPDPRAAAAEDRRKLKEEEAEKMEAKTASEHPDAKKQEPHYISKAKRAENVVEGGKTAAMVEETVAKRGGKPGAVATGASQHPRGGGVALASEAVVLPRHEDEKSFSPPSFPSVAAAPKAEGGGSAASEEAVHAPIAEPAANTEPTDTLEAIDMDIG